jgi:hypothetical protein
MYTTNANIVHNTACKLPPRLFEHPCLFGDRDLLSHRWMIYFRKYFPDKILSNHEWLSHGRRVYPVIAAIYVPEELQEPKPIKVHIDTNYPRSFHRRTIDVPICADFSPEHREIQKAINKIETYIRVNVFLPGYMPPSSTRAQSIVIQGPCDIEYCYAEVIFFDKPWGSHSFTIGDCEVVQDETGLLTLFDDPLVTNSERRLLSQMNSRGWNHFKDEDPFALYAKAVRLNYDLNGLPDAAADEKHLMLSVN